MVLLEKDKENQNTGNKILGTRIIISYAQIHAHNITVLRNSHDAFAFVETNSADSVHASLQGIFGDPIMRDAGRCRVLWPNKF
jgi:hypothetical protein